MTKETLLEMGLTEEQATKVMGYRFFSSLYLATEKDLQKIQNRHDCHTAKMGSRQPDQLSPMVYYQ